MKPPKQARDIVGILRRLANRASAQDESGVDPALIAGLISRGLIERDGEGHLALTDLGRTTLRRHLAGGDAFAAQHQSRATAAIRDGDGLRDVLVNLDESPLARLRRLKGGDGKPLIDASEFAAGERLRSDYSRAAIMPRVTANWSASVADGRRDGGAGGMAELTAAVIAARQRVERALDGVGPEFGGVLIDFCCFLKGLEEIERERRWPVRSAKLVLRLALSALARHFGLSATAEGGERSRKILHWGSDDYRPTIDGA